MTIADDCDCVLDAIRFLDVRRGITMGSRSTMMGFIMGGTGGSDDDDDDDDDFGDTLVWADTDDSFVSSSTFFEDP